MTSPFPTANQRVLGAVTDWLAAGYVSPDTPLLVACSGGADSLALAWATIAAHRDIPRPLRAVIVDHQLQAGSDQVAARAAAQLRQIGYRDVVIVPVAVGEAGGMEAAARTARYQALRQHAADGAAILLGHTADDQAETVLLGLARGSGPRSIAGMDLWSPPLGRPLLGVRRSDTVAACQHRGLDPWNDPHNNNPAFTRVRLRHEVIPLLEEVLGGGVVPALGRTATLMADDLAALDELADKHYRHACTPHGYLTVAQLQDLPLAIMTRIIRQWAAEQFSVTTLTYQHLRRAAGLVIRKKPGAAVRLPGGIDIVRKDAMLVWQKADGKVDT